MINFLNRPFPLFSTILIRLISYARSVWTHIHTAYIQKVSPSQLYVSRIWTAFELYLLPTGADQLIRSWATLILSFKSLFFFFSFVDFILASLKGQTKKLLKSIDHSKSNQMCFVYWFFLFVSAPWTAVSQDDWINEPQIYLSLHPELNLSELMESVQL